MNGEGRSGVADTPGGRTCGLVGYPAVVSILETTLVYAVIPLAICGVFALVTLRPKFAGRPRYRPGQEWDHPATWWSANPVSAATSGKPSTDRGGARGNW